MPSLDSGHCICTCDMRHVSCAALYEQVQVQGSPYKYSNSQVEQLVALSNHSKVHLRTSTRLMVPAVSLRRSRVGRLTHGALSPVDLQRRSRRSRRGFHSHGILDWAQGRYCDSRDVSLCETHCAERRASLVRAPQPRRPAPARGGSEARGAVRRLVASVGAAQPIPHAAISRVPPFTPIGSSGYSCTVGGARFSPPARGGPPAARRLHARITANRPRPKPQHTLLPTHTQPPKQHV